MSRDELTSEARAELDALDRILAREQVDEEHLELAALVASVRADAPRMDDALRARLEQTVTRRRRPVRPPRDLALAGAGLAAAAVALAIVISSGLLGAASGGGHRIPAVVGAQSNGTARSGHGPSVAHSPSPNFAKATPGTSQPPAAPTRLVHHASTLVLAAAVPSLEHIANAIAADTSRQRGVVASSSISLAGSASRASFSLRVPTTRLVTLVSTLSALGGVRSYSEQTNDITLRYDRERSLLARERVLQTQLRAEIAAAAAPEAATLRRHLAELERRIAVHRHLVAVARSSSATAHLTVSVVTVAPQPHNP